MRTRVLPLVAWLGLAASATAVGLATVSAVRAVVADEPVRVLTAAEVDELLAQPDANLAPIATLAASSTLPRGASPMDPIDPDAGAQVDSREAGVPALHDAPTGPTNADDRPSRLGSEPGTLSGSARSVRVVTGATRRGVRADGLAGPSRAGTGRPAPTASAAPDPSPPPPRSASPTPSTTTGQSPTPAPSTPTGTQTPVATTSPTPSGSPVATPTTPPPTPSATPSAAPASPSVTPSPTASGPVTPRGVPSPAGTSTPAVRPSMSPLHPAPSPTAAVTTVR